MNKINLKRISILLLISICLSLFACNGDQVQKETADSSRSESLTVTSSPSDRDETETVDNGEVSVTSTTESQKPDDGTESNQEESSSEAESETEDERLSAEYAPSKYFDAKAIYEMTKDGVYEDMAQLFYGYDEVTYHREEGKRPYTRLLAYNDYQTGAEAYISLCTSPMDVAPIFAVKYRTATPGINMEIYADSVNSDVTGGSNIRIPVTCDGEWHVEYVNLSRIKDFNGKSVNYFRFDFTNASILPVDSYVDFEYIGFFNSDDDIEMFETGKYVPTVYVDVNSGYKESTSIVHASSVDMINGAGGVGAGTFAYRGGNSSAGIDKFNHNATTLSEGLLVFSGWTVVDGGIEKFVWSVDGLTWYEATLHKLSKLSDLGQAHINATQSYTGTTVTDVENAVKGGGYQGNVNVANPEDRAKGIACDLSAFMGETVNVRFAAVPKSAPDELCLIAYVKGVEVVSEFAYEEETEATEIIDPTLDPEECNEHEISIYWYPVEGQLAETKVCVKCGFALESRDLAYYSSFDIIEHNGSNISGGYGAGTVIDKDGSAIVLRSGYDFVLQGWFACNGGVKDYVYSVDGGETWLVAGNSDKLVDRFRPEHIAAIKKADLGITKYDVKGMYRVNIPLKQFATDEEISVNVLFGASPLNNPSVVITIANIKNVKIPAVAEDGESSGTEIATEPPVSDELEFIKAIDWLVIGGVNVDNPAGGYGGNLFTYDASHIELASPTAVWQGWSGTDGGYAKWVYSVDDGKTWIDAGGSATDVTRGDIVGAIAGAGFTDFATKGMLNISADLSAYVGDTVSVIFGGVPVRNTSSVCQMVKIANINVKGSCPHAGIAWEPVAGEHKESATCAACGETVTRNIRFKNNIDAIEGSLNGAAHQVNPPDGVDLISRPTEAISTRDGKDVVVQGWFACNGGVYKYVYSADGGETWLDCGNQPNYNGAKFADSQPHINSINGSDLGFTALEADVNGLYRVTCDLKNYAGETVEVVFGAVLEENRTAEPIKLLIVTVTVNE